MVSRCVDASVGENYITAGDNSRKVDGARNTAGTITHELNTKSSSLNSLSVYSALQSPSNIFISE